MRESLFRRLIHGHGQGAAKTHTRQLGAISVTQSDASAHWEIQANAARLPDEIMLQVVELLMLEAWEGGDRTAVLEMGMCVSCGHCLHFEHAHLNIII
jgi:hypothetical protein